MTLPLRRRSDDLEEQAIDELEAILKDNANRLGFVITEFLVSKSRLNPRHWTTINIKLTKAQSNRRDDIVR